MPNESLSSGRGPLRYGAAMLAALQVLASFPAPAYAQAANSQPATRTPIKHVIVIIGENRTFDHYFGHLSLPKSMGGEGRTDENRNAEVKLVGLCFTQK